MNKIEKNDVDFKETVTKILCENLKREIKENTPSAFVLINIKK